MAEFIAIRHGHSQRQQLESLVCPVAREKIITLPDHEADLSQQGRKEVVTLGQYMFHYGGFLNGGSPDTYLVSPYLRARKTADALTYKGYELEPLLRERSTGLLEHLEPSHYQLFYPEAMDAYRSNPYFTPFPGGESLADTKERVREVLGRTLVADSRTLMVCHNGVMWGIRALVEELSPDFIIGEMQSNGSRPIKNCAVLHYTSDLPPGTEIHGSPSGKGLGLFRYYSLTSPAHTDEQKWPEARVWHHL